MTVWCTKLPLCEGYGGEPDHKGLLCKEGGKEFWFFF